MPLRLLRVAAICAAFLLYAGSVSAQPDSRPHALEKGSWALMYQVQDLLSISYYDGLLALKYHVADGRAIRFGLGANASSSNDRERVSGGATGQAQYLIYPYPEREVKFFIGAGPRIQYHINRIGEDLPGSYREESWSLGLAGALGTEWFITKHISIVGEFGNHLGLSLIGRDLPPPDDSSTDYFYRTSARLGIAAYL